MDEARTTAERLLKELLGVPLNNTSTITINAGGVGVWVAVTCCLVMLFSTLIGAVWLSREFARVDKELNERKEEGQRMQSYLSAIYVQAPSLRPPEEKKHADR